MKILRTFIEEDKKEVFIKEALPLFPIQIREKIVRHSINGQVEQMAGLLLLNIAVSLWNKDSHNDIDEFISWNKVLTWVYKPNLDFNLIYGPKGKPYFKDSNIFFNISNSKRMVVVVVHNEEVGIDIEWQRSKILSVAKRAFSKEDYEYILEGNQKEQEERFLLAWTVKEAYVKFLGDSVYTMTLPSNILKGQDLSVSDELLSNVAIRSQKYDSSTRDRKDGYRITIVSSKN